MCCSFMGWGVLAIQSMQTWGQVGSGIGNCSATDSPCDPRISFLLSETVSLSVNVNIDNMIYYLGLL